MKSITYKLIILLFLSLSLISTSQANANNCISNLFYSTKVLKETFLNCKNNLSKDKKNANTIFTELCFMLESPEYKDFYDPINHLGFIKSDYEYFDFDSMPRTIHRYRAIFDILKEQLNKGNIDNDILIQQFKKGNNYKLSIFIINTNRNYTDQYIEFIDKEIFRNTTIFNSKERSSLRRIAEHILIKYRPEQYVNEIGKYILENHKEELTSLINHVFTDKVLAFLSEGIKAKLVENLFQQALTKTPYYAYFDVVAIEKLTTIEFRKEIFKQIDYSKNKEKAHALIQEKALEYYNQNYKKE